MPQLRHPPYSCWICGNEVDLETCNIDEHGMAVHEGCYLAKLALAFASTSLALPNPAVRIPPIGVSDIALRNIESSTR